MHPIASCRCSEQKVAVVDRKKQPRLYQVQEMTVGKAQAKQHQSLARTVSVRKGGIIAECLAESIHPIHDFLPWSYITPGIDVHMPYLRASKSET